MHSDDPVRLTLAPGPTDLELTRLADRLDAAVTEAAALALGYFGKAPKNWLKGGHSPVSEADMAVDALLGVGARAIEPGHRYAAVVQQLAVARTSMPVLAVDHLQAIGPVTLQRLVDQSHFFSRPEGNEALVLLGKLGLDFEQVKPVAEHLKHINAARPVGG